MPRHCAGLTQYARAPLTTQFMHASIVNKLMQRDTCYAFQCADSCTCHRQEKAQQLLSLQAELQLLESDIKQVAGRKEVAPSPEPAQAPQLPSMTPDTAGVGKSNLVHAGNNQTASHSSSSAAVSGLLPSALLPGHEANQPATAAASILSKCLPVQSSSGQLPPHTAAPALAPCTTDGSMSRASNGYLMITNPYVGQPIPCSASGSARLPTAISAPDAAPAVASTSATAAPAHPVAPPTQLGANGSMHIHPRHLAFQHFQQQQAALQQRQQQPVNGHGLASAHSLDSTDADALDRMDRAASLASAQSDAIRYRTRPLAPAIMSMEGVA